MVAMIGSSDGQKLFDMETSLKVLNYADKA
jgi:hypothetical protein